MKKPELARIVWLVPAVMCLLAPLHWPYAYYTLLRWVVCGASVAIVWRQAQSHGFPLCIAVPVAIGLLFNPIIPIHLSRSTWLWFDLGAAILFVGHMLWVRERIQDGAGEY